MSAADNNHDADALLRRVLYSPNRLPHSGEWQAAKWCEPVWGTVVELEVRNDEIHHHDVEEAFRQAAAFLHQTDRWFSTYRIDTPITAMRNGYLLENHAPAVVRNVLATCREIRDYTNGAFDPWKVAGGVDPSGYVKGWAAGIAANQLVDAGFPNVMVNAAGDVVCRGFQSPHTPWQVGIQHPHDTHHFTHVVSAHNTSVATSGRYILGNHIIDPRTRQPARHTDSATVVGPHPGWAEGLATALIVLGPPGLKLLHHLDAPEQWSAIVIANNTLHSTGTAFQS